MMTEQYTFSLPSNSNLSSAVLSGDVYSSPETPLSEMPIYVGGKEYTIIRWGHDNRLPYQIKELVEKNSVMSQNKHFNMLTCYGRGLEYMDAATMGDKEPKPTLDKEIREWILHNSLKRFFAEQIVDIKFFFFSVAVIILDRERRHIVKVVHKDVCHCRFEKPDENGRIDHVFYANWKDSDNPEHIEMISLLDEQDPYGDLRVRVGLDSDRYSEFSRDKANVFKYAVVCKMPVPGAQVYPIPAWTASLRDGWYDIYGYLTAAKKAKIKNGQNIRYHVEINTEFWDNRARAKGISLGTEEFETMKREFIEELKKYLGGSENSDKVIWSEFEALMDGTEKHYLKISTVDTSKAGNEYNDDVAEASNVLCYDDNVHPNLAGATPGKSQMNNSGSDKRELFTMKQALETLPHDIMMAVHNTIIYFNGWAEKVVPVVPMIMLTTLDKNTDGKQVNMSNENNSSHEDLN